MDNIIVYIRRQPGDLCRASINLSDISDLKWDNITGGYHNTCNQFYPFGYISLDDILEGEVSCSGRHDYSKNGIKVVLLKKDNQRIYQQLIESLGPRPKNFFRPVGQPTCTKKIIEILEENNVMKRKILINELKQTGYEQKTIRSALNHLRKSKRILAYGSASPNQIIEIYKPDIY